MKFNDIKVGMKLLYVGEEPRPSKLIGFVKQIIGNYFYIFDVVSFKEIGCGWINADVWEPYYNSRCMLAGDRRVNTKVVCVTRDGGPNTYGRAGIITDVDYNNHYTVTDDYGANIGSAAWSKLTSFEVILDEELGSRPMNKSDIQIGVRVIGSCTGFVGREGIISYITGDTFYVSDDNDQRIGAGEWSVGSWRIPLTPIKPITSEPTKVQAQTVITTVCPSYYMGPDACICGKHDKKPRFVFR